MKVYRRAAVLLRNSYVTVDTHSACVSSQAIFVLTPTCYLRRAIWFGSEGNCNITAQFGYAFIDDGVLYVAGNLMVILVVTISRRLRSITNFFLANLAVADLCVGVFCVYQNLSTYLAARWVRPRITPVISWVGTACVGRSDDGLQKCRNM